MSPRSHNDFGQGEEVKTIVRTNRRIDIHFWPQRHFPITVISRFGKSNGVKMCFFIIRFFFFRILFGKFSLINTFYFDFCV